MTHPLSPDIVTALALLVGFAWGAWVGGLVVWWNVRQDWPGED